MATEEFFKNHNINSLAEQLYKENPKATLWDIIVELLSRSASIEPFRIWILSDFSVVELVAKGHSIDYIMEYLEMSRAEVMNTCKIWGLKYYKDTLDFDPTLVYNEDTTVDQLRQKLEPVLYGKVSDEELLSVINNVEKYFGIKELLDEWEGNNSE